MDQDSRQKVLAALRRATEILHAADQANPELARAQHALSALMKSTARTRDEHRGRHRHHRHDGDDRES